MGNGVSGAQNGPQISSVSRTDAQDSSFIVSRFHQGSVRRQATTGFPQDGPLMLMPNRAARRLLSISNVNVRPRRERLQSCSAPAIPEGASANVPIFPSPSDIPKPQTRRYLNYAREARLLSANLPTQNNGKEKGGNNVTAEEIGANDYEKVEHMESDIKEEHFGFYDDTEEVFVHGDELDEEVNDDLMMASAPADMMKENLKQKQMVRGNDMNSAKLPSIDVSSNKDIVDDQKMSLANEQGKQFDFDPMWQFWDSGGVKLESLCNFSIVGCQWTVNSLLGW